MNPITTTEEYQKILDVFNDENMHYSNLAILEEDIDKIIEKKTLYYIDHDSSIIFIVDNGHQYDLYFKTEKLNLQLPKLSKKVVVDFHGDLQDVQTFTDEFKEIKFKVFAQSSKLHLKSTIDLDNKILQYYFIRAQKKDISKIHEIWQESLGIESEPLPTKKEIEEMIETVFVLKDNQDIVGCVQIERNDNSAMIGKVAVERNERGKGIGQVLLLNSLSLLHNKVVYLWVNKKNDRAINLYKKNGFRKTRINSVQMVQSVS